MHSCEGLYAVTSNLWRQRFGVEMLSSNPTAHTSPPGWSSETVFLAICPCGYNEGEQDLRGEGGPGRVAQPLSLGDNSPQPQIPSA